MPYSFNPLSGLGLDQSIPLDGAGKIPSDYLPSYVDDVVEYANLAGFPATGETGKIYVAIDTGFTYRWSGSVYIQINSLTGTFAADAGTAAAPSISIGTADNGLYAPAEDQVAISTNGTGRLFVDANGRTGINTTPDGTGSLAVRALTDTTNGGIVIFSTDGNGAVISRLNDGGLTFRNGGSERLRITSDGKLGLGTSSPAQLLETQDGNIQIRNLNGLSQNTLSTYGLTFRNTNQFGQDRGTIAEIKTYLAGAGDNDFGLQFRTQATTAGGVTTKMTLTPGGSLGIGTTSPSKPLHISSTDDTPLLAEHSDGTSAFIQIKNTGGSASVSSSNNDLRFLPGEVEKARIDSSGTFRVKGNGTAGVDDAVQLNGSAPANSLLLDASGRLLVGTTSSTNVNTRAVFQGYGTSVDEYAIVCLKRGDDPSVAGSGLGLLSFGDKDADNVASIGAYRDTGTWTHDVSEPTRLVFSTTADGAASPTERMRITSNGSLLTGGLTSQNQSSDALGIHGIFASLKRSNDPGLLVGRDGADGVLVYFYQDGSNEGSISVSGTTVSYNGAHLSRWSQLPGGAERTEILRGTVLSNIDEMCGWGEEENEQLNRMKVSDVEGDPNVSGVFQSWDDDDDMYTDDFYCAMTGDFIIRIGVGVTVQRGDLLMSAGDGTAKPQDDDIIRSKTIAKVTSTYVTCTYDDGSYCVPCVLMAC